jgi:hypothetical protein
MELDARHLSVEAFLSSALFSGSESLMGDLRRPELFATAAEQEEEEGAAGEGADGAGGNFAMGRQGSSEAVAEGEEEATT